MSCEGSESKFGLNKLTAKVVGVCEVLGYGQYGLFISRSWNDIPICRSSSCLLFLIAEDTAAAALRLLHCRASPTSWQCSTGAHRRRYAADDGGLQDSGRRGGQGHDRDRVPFSAVHFVNCDRLKSARGFLVSDLRCLGMRLAQNHLELD